MRYWRVRVFNETNKGMRFILIIYLKLLGFVILYNLLGKIFQRVFCCKSLIKGKKLGSPFIDYLKKFDISDDFFFKGAPVVIVLSSKSNINAGLASSYMELMAYNLGLGVLYSGFFVACTKLSRKLRKLLQLPKGHEVISCMVIGYPDVNYQRIAPRKALQVRKL